MPEQLTGPTRPVADTSASVPEANFQPDAASRPDAGSFAADRAEHAVEWFSRFAGPFFFFLALGALVWLAVRFL